MSLLDSTRPLDALRCEITVRRIQRREPLDVAQIIEGVGSATGVTAKRILSRQRCARFSRARWIAMHLARRSGATVREIARHFGRCPATVRYGLRKALEQNRA